MAHTIADSMRDASRLLARIVEDAALTRDLERCADLLAYRLRAGRTIIACGNGGSLCDASHFVEELTGRFRADRPALRAIALNDPGHLTCVANDYGFEEVFSRAIQALGAPEDVLITLSTSGNSENIARAIHAARERRMATIAFLGRGGGKVRGLSEIDILIPEGSGGEGRTSDRVQEIHMLMLHTLVEGIERRLFPDRTTP